MRMRMRSMSTIRTITFFLLTIIGLVSWNEKNRGSIFRLVFSINYWGPGAIEKNRGCIFPIIIFPIINYFRILERDSNDTFSMIFPAQWEKTGVNSQLFFSIATNYNYFRILGLGDKEPTFFFISTTINYCHAAANEKNRQELLFFFELM